MGAVMRFRAREPQRFHNMDSRTRLYVEGEIAVTLGLEIVGWIRLCSRWARSSQQSS